MRSGASRRTSSRRGGPETGLTDVETGPPQHRGDELADLVGVLHDEHGLFGHDLSSSPIRSTARTGRALRHLTG